MELTIQQLAECLDDFANPAPGAFPGSWRGMSEGAVVLELLALRSWSSWSAVPADHKNALRSIFHMLKSGELKVVSGKTSDRDKRALIGDALHKLDLRIVLVAKGLEGPDKMQWETWYGSNDHQAEYLSKLMNLPKPTTKLGIHNAGSEFESRYATEKDFRTVYLGSTFGSDLANAAVFTVKELVN